ncbi:hypothetical protein CJD36_021550 [Flavipsychrobacter stenotrophus]|uniref:histidine kinase n=1 Tax=Flavipsychrobacter stenotrophus TaxID=2077091 RepID=A0A2S7SQ14_9BACT|nr:HAMP domain-containing sensor histidine kinase [Flavipsychrobacter stenotrophus]PQJ08993.1 hypothetical protein CJD36_021550 [Flavipsychrobacter stenotrophus]
MRIKILSLTYILVAISSICSAQHSYNFEYITTENGLPSDGIKGLEIDKKLGFLWIATEAGLVRYNGQHFSIFNNENQPKIISDKVFPLCKRPDGNIFALTGKRILYVAGNKLEVYKNDYFYDHYGNELINVYLHKGPVLHSPSGVNNYDKFLPIDSTLCLIEKEDTLWEFRALTNQKKYVAPLFKHVYSFEIGNNVFFYDNNDNFFIYDTTEHKLKSVLLTDKVGTEKSLPSGKKHLYWVPGMPGPIALAGTNAWALSYNNGKIVAEIICTAIPQNFSIKFVQYWEEEHILFLGTTSKGIIIIRENYLQNIKKIRTEFDEPNAIYSQILLSNGNILTNTGDVIGPYTSSPGIVPIKRAYNNNTIITTDSILWYTTNDTLYKYDYRHNASKKITYLSGAGYVAFLETKGQLYVANHKGIYLIKNDSLSSLIEYKNLGYPFNLSEYKPGVVALGMATGLFKFDLTSKKLDTLLITQYPVRALWKYKDYLFVGTYGEGIYVMKNDNIKKLPLDNNNYLDYAHCFMLDSGGYCWMSTNRGLFKARLQDMIDAYEKGTLYVYYQFYGRNEGMDITEMNGGCTPCAIWLANKTISFPTMDGALWVTPTMPTRLPDSNIFIDQIIVNGGRLDTNFLDCIYFDAHTNDISFNLGFSAWCDKENLYLQYTLDPAESKWQKINTDHPVIRLSNLPYGQYILYIRKLTGFGENNFIIKKICFEIQPPWYMRWWGQASIIFVFLFIVAVVSILANRSSLRRQIRLRNLLDKKTTEILKQNEQLEKNDRIKTRLISIISHDIITPLKFLHLTSKYLFERKASLTENLQTETLEEVVNTSRELELLSTNILNWIKYQNEERRIVKEEINLHDLVEQVFVVLKSLAHKNHIELINNIPKDILLMQFVDPLRVIIYNLVVNAINFTKQGSITVSCTTSFDEVQVNVKDTGMGMSRTQVNNIKSDLVVVSATNVNKRSGHGLGFLIIKDLLKMINGVFDIESKVHEGTTVSITFPM